jgi:hypothetical protein
MPWTREFLLTQLFILYLAFALSTYVKALAFCILCSDNEDPKRGATTAPSSDTRAADEPFVQEVEPVVKSLKAPKASNAPVKKLVTTRGSKRLKKSTDAGVSLEIHQSTSSSNDVCVGPGTLLLFFALSSYSCVFLTGLDEEICHFGR